MTPACSASRTWRSTPSTSSRTTTSPTAYPTSSDCRLAVSHHWTSQPPSIASAAPVISDALTFIEPAAQRLRFSFCLQGAHRNIRQCHLLGSYASPYRPRYLHEPTR